MTPNSALLLCLNAPELDQEFLLRNIEKHTPAYKLIEEIKPPKVFLDAENKGLKILSFKNNGS